MAAPYSSPVVFDGAVYFSNNDKNDKNVYALDAATGKRFWKYQTTDGINSSLVVLGSTVYFGAKDGYVYAVDAAAGTLLWRYQSNGASPVVVEDTVYFRGYLSGTNRDVYCALHTATGTLRWKYPVPSSYSPPVVVGDTVYFSSLDHCLRHGATDGCVGALDAVTGTLRWKYQGPSGFYSFPVGVGDAVYLHFYGNPSLYQRNRLGRPGRTQANNEKCLYVLDAATGELRWKYQTEDVVVSSPVVAGGTIYFGSNDGYVYALER